ncbi:helix-turn-helix domain-containing protein [Mycoplana ramosa]|uniref:Helix-turn-helix domain-containing protein n=1 Tax=Mycoplana ramosa TaxID=40837 RepID=A0ABW3YXT2_MYCRA
MKTPTSADALRVARALLGLSQREAAAAAEMTQKALSAAESGKNSLLETNLQLIRFYEGRGIEFLGEARIGREIAGAGARFRGPPGPGSDLAETSEFHSMPYGVSFLAARSLLGEEQAYVAAKSGLPLKTIRALEHGATWSAPTAQLRAFYEAAGVRFTGWGDVETGRYYRVGVRWAAQKSQDVSGEAVANGDVVDS